MVLIVLLSASAVSFYFFTPWIAVPITILSLVSLRAIQFKFANTTVEDEIHRTIGAYREELPPGLTEVMGLLPRTGSFFGSIILICLGYFAPVSVLSEKELLVRLLILLLGGFGFHYHAPAVGMTRILGFIVPFLCITIPVAGSLLGFRVFGLR